MSPRLASVSTHTHSDTFTHNTLRVRPRQTGSTPLHSCFILGCIDKKACLCPNMVLGRWNVPGRQPISSGLDADVLPCDARTGFHWRKIRGSVPAKNTPQRKRRSRGAITGWKMLKITAIWRRRRFLAGNVDIIQVYTSGVCYQVSDRETPAYFFSIFQKIESLYCFATKRFRGKIITSTFKRFNWKYTFYLLCFYIYFILLLAFLIAEIIQERGPLQFLITNAKLIIIINKTEWQLGEEG